MKKLSLLLVIISVFLLLPISVFAEDNKKVNVYFFRGEGCSHCAEAEEFFNSIQDEYGDYFTIIDYETWYNEDNQKLMEKVADARKEEAGGVPYIIIGDQSWNGYASDYDQDIKNKIVEVYKQDPKDRYDIMKYIDKKPKKDDNSSSIIGLILIILIAGGIGTGVYFTRKSVK